MDSSSQLDESALREKQLKPLLNQFEKQEKTPLNPSEDQLDLKTILKKYNKKLGYIKEYNPKQGIQGKIMKLLKGYSGKNEATPLPMRNAKVLTRACDNEYDTNENTSICVAQNTSTIEENPEFLCTQINFCLPAIFPTQESQSNESEAKYSFDANLIGTSLKLPERMPKHFTGQEEEKN